MQKNRIKEILKARGFDNVVISDEQLEIMNIVRTRFLNITRNTVQMKAPEAIAIAKWLDITVEDLYEKKTPLSKVA